VGLIGGDSRIQFYEIDESCNLFGSSPSSLY
jgi:hypothetical protein